MPEQEKNKEPSASEEYCGSLLEKQDKEAKLAAGIEVPSSFVITEADQKRIEAWRKVQDARAGHMQQESGKYKDDPYVEDLLRRGIPYSGVCRGALTYHFSPSGGGTIFTVSHDLTKATLDVRGYDNLMAEWDRFEDLGRACMDMEMAEEKPILPCCLVFDNYHEVEVDGHREFRCGTCGTLCMEMHGTTAKLSRHVTALIEALEGYGLPPNPAP